jgi:cytochrome c oxidase subunit 1
MAFFQIFFVINLFGSWKFGKKVTSDNPWDATTLEWATPTPPGHGNFLTEPVTYRGPYEYSRPDCEADFLPQWVAPKNLETTEEKDSKH